jgi:hypothetical protein
MIYYKFEDVLEEEMKNEKFREAYEEMEEEFQLAEEIIKESKIYKNPNSWG